MLLGHHLIFGAYGFWLPNDPRGSWSNFVGSYDLYLAGGKATTTDSVDSVAQDDHDHISRITTKRTLKLPPVVFSASQVEQIGIGFGEYSRKSQVVIQACSIMPNHVHLVLAVHRLNIDQLSIQFKAAATRQLLEMSLHPFQLFANPKPKCFAQRKWDVEIDSEKQLHDTIEYVEQNPVKAGLPKQHWSFVSKDL